MSPDAVTVLVVDDTEDIRSLWKIALYLDSATSLWGEACDGAEAIAMTVDDCPDVILLDLVMPGVGGIEALPTLRRQCPFATIVVVSAIVDHAIRAEAMALGAAGVFEKTTPLAALLCRIADR